MTKIDPKKTLELPGRFSVITKNSLDTTNEEAVKALLETFKELSHIGIKKPLKIKGVTAGEIKIPPYLTEWFKSLGDLFEGKYPNSIIPQGEARTKAIAPEKEVAAALAKLNSKQK